MNSLIFVRHSIPEIDPEIPSDMWPLSRDGEYAAHELARRLGKYAPRHIISSPELKALGTANILSAHLDCMVGIEADLREHERRQVGFMPSAVFAAQIARFLQSSSEVTFGDECADEVYTRFSQTIKRVLSQYHDENIVVVTHGTALSLYLGRLCQIDALELWQSLQLPDAFSLPASLVSASYTKEFPECGRKLARTLQRI